VGFDAQSQPVRQPAVADVPAAVIGYRVRTTSTFSSQADADAYVTRLKASGRRPYRAAIAAAGAARTPARKDPMEVDRGRHRGLAGLVPNDHASMKRLGLVAGCLRV
jgi:hypothetical protein